MLLHIGSTIPRLERIDTVPARRVTNARRLAMLRDESHSSTTTLVRIPNIRADPAWYSQCMCGRYTVTIDKSTIEKRFGSRFYIAQPS